MSISIHLIRKQVVIRPVCQIESEPTYLKKIIKINNNKRLNGEEGKKRCDGSYAEKLTVEKLASVTTRAIQDAVQAGAPNKIKGDLARGALQVHVRIRICSCYLESSALVIVCTK